jgi:diguanylate cyclase (GGDEF)-like protein
MPPNAHVLVVDSSKATAAALLAALSSAKIGAVAAHSGEQAWRALAAKPPTVILLDHGAPGGAEFLRRIRDEFMGASPRLLATADWEQLDQPLLDAGFEAVLLKPVAPELVVGAVHWTDTRAGSITLDAGRLREMLRLTALGGDMQSTLDGLARRLALLYRGAHECLILASANERNWIGSLGGSRRLPWPELWDECRRIANAGAPLVLSGPSPNGHTAVETRLVVPIPGPSDAAVGAISILSSDAAIYAADARDALSDLARRFGTELAWRTVHERVSAERDQLRESAMLDPQLGILSRAALEQSLRIEIARYRRSREPLCLAVIDVSGLRLINDRYGHVVGDRVLQQLAQLITEHVRSQDIVARYGGDEIAVLLAATPINGATILLDRLRSAVACTPIEIPGRDPLHIGTTAGVIEFSDDDDDGTLALAQAAKAAASRAAKEHGGTVVVTEQASPGATTMPTLSMPPSDRFEAGITLGGMYQIVHEISRGAMGVVYRAEDLGLSRPVALKRLRPDLATDSALVERFRNEAAVLAALRHENLVQVYAFGADDDDVYFVMELVEGVSLEDVIEEHNHKQTWSANRRVVNIMEQIAGALDTMHDAGVLHRDVKPGNVVLDRARDRAVLVDVGLARQIGSESDPAGTPGYIAPESFQGQQEGPATDVYGLAATAYALLLQQSPFGEHDDYQIVLRRQLSIRPPAASTLRPELPQGVDIVLWRGLAVDPKDRYRSAGQFAQAFTDALMAVPRELTVPIRAVSDAEIGLRDDAAPHPPSVPPGKGLRWDTVPQEVDVGDTPTTRGILFRCAARVIGVSTSAAWLAGIARKNRPLATALSPHTSPLGWLPAGLFLELLAEVRSGGRNPDTFARELARKAVSDTFARFYPSSRDRIEPQATLSATDVLWRRYHSWGAAECRADGDRAARAVFTNLLEGPGICAMVEGFLGQIIVLSGGKSTTVAHTACAFRGAPACEFALGWE